MRISSFLPIALSMAQRTMKVSRQAELGLLQKKEISLPYEMINDALANSPDGKATFEQMNTKKEKAILREKYLARGSKILGVESRWRFRLTQCAKQGNCPCSEKIDVDYAPFGVEGAFKSNNGTKFYAPNTNCIWKLHAPKDYTILMRFNRFAVEREDVCGFDYAMIYSGKMEYLNNKEHNDTVKAEGVFCGSIKDPQNVGDDDWNDKSTLVPTSDSGDDTLNRTFFNGQWTDLRNNNAGIIFVTDGDTQHTGFELEWRVLPKMQNVNVTGAEDAVDYVRQRILDDIENNPMNSKEEKEEKIKQVTKTMDRMITATKKNCYHLEGNVVPLEIQNGIKTTNTAIGFFPYMLDLIFATHKKCRQKHRVAWKRRFDKLQNTLWNKVADQDSSINTSDDDSINVGSLTLSAEEENGETQHKSPFNPDDSVFAIE
ncbi:Oidioi.mRNA.OKI2018_I69.XSR.g15219.t1.cds [Oikopleura dioica]|uniref:Oidioi.mRNA.OKI2018_I69.XSR.g15219.t1.cds n=1 Tax=Oikopleura dioica TaxID=34765 RepID=A0ABN7SH65_OIKDI|nr:Oidioi.mRNA.OKI2018_I69.XSR.g15219.t1.cds [Oikopleura dioica]